MLCKPQLLAAQYNTASEALQIKHSTTDNASSVSQALSASQAADIPCLGTACQFSRLCHQPFNGRPDGRTAAEKGT